MNIAFSFGLIPSFLYYGFQRLIKNLVKYTTQRMKFSIKDFFSKCDQTAGNCGFGHIY